MTQPPAYFKTPDVTPVQLIGAVVAATLNLLRVFGVDLSDAQVEAIKDLTDVVIALLATDAVIRAGRAIGSARRG